MITEQCRKSSIQARLKQSSNRRHALKLFVISLLLDFPNMSREEVCIICRDKGYGGGLSGEAYLAARRAVM